MKIIESKVENFQKTVTNTNRALLKLVILLNKFL